MSFVHQNYLHNKKNSRKPSHGPYADSARTSRSPRPTDDSDSDSSSSHSDDEKKSRPKPKHHHWFSFHHSDEEKSQSQSANMSNNSGSIGAPNIYADGDQRNAKAGENTADRFHEGKANSHLANDSKDERSIANKLAREEKRGKEEEELSEDAQRLKKDATLPAKAHGNEPSKGAKIDQELREEEEAELAKKGKK